MTDIAVFVDGTQMENSIHFTPVKEIVKQSRSRASGCTLFKDFISEGASSKSIMKTSETKRRMISKINMDHPVKFETFWRRKKIIII